MASSLPTQISEGVRKAAILVMSLDEDEAAALLARLPRHYVERVSIAIAQMDTVSGQEQERVIQEFLESRPSILGPNSGGLDKAKNLVKKALGKDANDTLSVLQQTLESLPFGFLHKTDPQNILSFLIDEHPQTIALVLSHLPPQTAAGVLAGLPLDRRLSVIERIAEMGQTSPDAIEEVENVLSSRMSLFLTQGYRKAGGVPAVAEMLNVCDRTTERAILDALSKEKPELVEEIRRLMFVFEDLLKLSDKDIQTVLKNVETSQWAMALKGASQALQEKILSNMSQRAAEMLREEMEFLGKVRLSEVEAVQQKIVDVVRSLEDAGQITRPTGDQEEEFVA
ncbi:MAG: flagellar motor switch protein FliG [Planctomycetota bacterium]|nr:MAG: flagellar motor switch protein FliG [Planctomycetota bacterium]